MAATTSPDSAPSEAGADAEGGRAPAAGFGRRVLGFFTVDRLVLLGAFAVSRVAYGMAGVVFDASGIDYSSQLLDQTLLKDRLLESVWYLHAQPPAYNLFVGAVLKFSPFSRELSFHLAFLALGLVMILVLYDLGRRLRLGRWTAVVVAIVIACAPTIVLFENWLSYEYPVAVMLLVLVDLAAHYGETRRTGVLVAAVSVAALATLTRSMLHPVWLLAVFLCLVLYRRPTRKGLALAVLPLLVVLLFVVKNEVLFGTPQLSSWFGYNVRNVVIGPLTDEQKGILAAEGFVPATPADCTVKHPDVPAVADEFKRFQPDYGGDPIANFNNECVIVKFNAMQQDAFTVAKARPKWVARNVGGAVEIWSTPSSLNPFVFQNRQKVGGPEEAYRRVLLLDTAWDPVIPIPNAWPVKISAPDARHHVSITMVLATALVSIGAIAVLARWRRRSGARLAVLVGGGTVLFAAMAGTLFEYSENNRIRFVTEPLTLLLAVAIVAFGIRWIRARRATPTAAAAVDDSGPAVPSLF